MHWSRFQINNMSHIFHQFFFDFFTPFLVLLLFFFFLFLVIRVDGVIFAFFRLEHSLRLQLVIELLFLCQDHIFIVSTSVLHILYFIRNKGVLNFDGTYPI